MNNNPGIVGYYVRYRGSRKYKLVDKNILRAILKVLTDSRLESEFTIYTGIRYYTEEGRKMVYRKRMEYWK